MLISWTSATNGARVYDSCLSQPENFPDHPDWMDTSFKLRPEHVWDGFIILSLLEDHTARSAILRVPHTGDQRDRFTAAMEERNARIQLCGQPEWGHYCTKCLRVWDENGKLSRFSAFEMTRCLDPMIFQQKFMSSSLMGLQSGIRVAGFFTAQSLSRTIDTGFAPSMLPRAIKSVPLKDAKRLQISPAGS